jgi:hypothetical protein
MRQRAKEMEDVKGKFLSRDSACRRKKKDGEDGAVW